MSSASERVLSIADKHQDKFLEIFRHLHRNPEISNKEYDTSAYISGILSDLGIELIDIGQKTGVVGLLTGAQDGPCIALRADIDALPVKEDSTCPFPSEREGAMHACGHDTHITSLLSAAIILSEMRDEIKGSVKFIFQPAEERNLGAISMISAGVLEDPQVSACFSFHNSPEIPTGTVAVLSGPIMAGLNTIDIVIKGKGGHGGIPQKNTDPVVAAAAIIQSLQTIVSRNMAPTDPGVVSICSVHTNNKLISNVIPDSVHMEGTVRFYSYENKALINRRIDEIVRNIGEAYGCETEFWTSEDLPITSNAPLPGQRDLFDIAIKTVETIGAAPVSLDPSGGGDDFSHYRLGAGGKPGVPSFFYWLGVRNEEKDCIYSWHSPHYQADTDAIIYGAKLLAESAVLAAEELLKIN
ncbi:MAG: M20 family metallopeptidase [Oscillospiraceae bacterium]|nr:M20 family metallopeptidase [Oscillospiraceae bacterium]